MRNEIIIEYQSDHRRQKPTYRAMLSANPSAHSKNNKREPILHTYRYAPVTFSS